ncbi:hypothetical protein D9756_008023 [Leucocoprinus leucothites]|uniref:Uncharacterized protein n=1 Tax=Leucocoprinus leucothites TaxID=201217 RepID=A0A8H5D731_9AGAR|nr:hypothetical protein D9756_008023 [Leucoagaricus leucothites]
MPSFSDMKAKASKVANSGVERAQGFRDRNTSVAMKKTNWDPYNGAPPPPPPPKVNPNNKPKVLAALPPPPSRTGTSIGSGSNTPATLSRAPSTASAIAPPLPSRGSSSGAPPPIPRRTNTLEPPPLPGRRNSTSPVLSNTATPSPPPPPPRSPLPPPSRAPVINQATPPPPPAPNLTTKPGSAPVLHTPTPAPAFPRAPPRRSPIISPKPPTPEIEYYEPEAIAEKAEIDWANLTDEDKQVFFSWLDEFFTRSLGIPIGPKEGLESIHA